MFQEKLKQLTPQVFFFFLFVSFLTIEFGARIWKAYFPSAVRTAFSAFLRIMVGAVWSELSETCKMLCSGLKTKQQVKDHFFWKNLQAWFWRLVTFWPLLPEVEFSSEKKKKGELQTCTLPDFFLSAANSEGRLSWTFWGKYPSKYFSRISTETHPNVYLA